MEPQAPGLDAGKVVAVALELALLDAAAAVSQTRGLGLGLALALIAFARRAAVGLYRVPALAAPRPAMPGEARQ